MISFRSILLLVSTITTTVIAAPHRGSYADQAPPLPSSGLPSPTDLKLKFITIGVGHQNYTCNSSTGTYGSNVALAQLFDATRYLSKHPEEVSTISQARYEQFTKAGQCAEESNYRPTLWQIGEHYFEPTTPVIPDFDLYEVDLFLEAKKISNVPAPDTKNIDWLYLTDNGKGETKGLKAVYRVETVGGKPPSTCAGTEKIFIPYVAQYWFYD